MHCMSEKVPYKDSKGENMNTIINTDEIYINTCRIAVNQMLK